MNYNKLDASELLAKETTNVLEEMRKEARMIGERMCREWPELLKDNG
jgi:hypothetical protein